MLKLEYLRYHHNLSDREVIARSVTDLAFRNFLRIPLRGYLPDPSTLCVFRGRLGREGFRNIFTRVVQIAREYGVVKDRLRIKDATHVIGNIAVPSTLALVAQIRDKLLSAAEPFAPRMVEGERVNLELLREATKGLNPKEKLVTRVAQLRENLVWADTLTPPKQAETNRPWQLFLVQRDLAHKILEDLEHPTAGDRTISVIDPDARSAKNR
jgi:IS5 family transposase